MACIPYAVQYDYHLIIEPRLRGTGDVLVGSAQGSFNIVL